MPKCHAGGVHGSKGAREWVYTQVCHGIGCHGTGLVCKQQVFAKSGFGQSCVGLRVQAAVDPIIESPTTAKLPLYLSGAPSTHHQQWLLDSSPRSKPRIAGRNANLARAQLSHDTATHCTHSPRKLLSVHILLTRLPLCIIPYNYWQCFAKNLPLNIVPTLKLLPSSAASAISGRTRTRCIQRRDDFMLLAQNPNCCRYAFVHVRWHACMGVVATAHVWQQAACTQDK